MRAPSQITLGEAAEAWLAGVRDGSIRNRSGDRYKPSVVRGYETALRLRVLPQIGARKLSEIRRSDLQDFADRLLGDGADTSTTRNTLMPLRAIFRCAAARGDVAVNPTSGLEVELHIPRDRRGTFEPTVVPKYQRRGAASPWLNVRTETPAGQIGGCRTASSSSTRILSVASLTVADILYGTRRGDRPSPPACDHLTNWLRVLVAEQAGCNLCAGGETVL